MRLVVDTNVFVSAALKEASWPAAVVRFVAQAGGLVKTAETERELFAVLQRPRIAVALTPLFAIRIRAVFAAAELVAITDRVASSRDPKDDKFLELAVNGQADAIVSGDADLLTLDAFRGIPIITPAVFVRAFAV